MKILATVLIGSVLFWASIRIIASKAIPPLPLGLRENRLTPCPDKPNCTDSRSTNEPIAYSGNRTAAHARLLEVVRTHPRVRIEKSSRVYIHAVAHSRVFGFLDDVEFYLPDGEGVIHYRSAARSGYSDLGVNRSRIDSIVARFNTANTKSGSL